MSDPNVIFKVFVSEVHDCGSAIKLKTFIKVQIYAMLPYYSLGSTPLLLI